MPVDDETRHLVGLVGDHLLVQKCRQRQIGKRVVGGDPFLAALGRNPGELIAAALRRGLAEQRLELAKHIAALSNRCTIHKEARIDRPRGAASASVAGLARSESRDRRFGCRRRRGFRKSAIRPAKTFPPLPPRRICHAVRDAYMCGNLRTAGRR